MVVFFFPSLTFSLIECILPSAAKFTLTKAILCNTGNDKNVSIG